MLEALAPHLSAPHHLQQRRFVFFKNQFQLSPVPFSDGNLNFLDKKDTKHGNFHFLCNPSRTNGRPCITPMETIDADYHQQRSFTPIWQTSLVQVGSFIANKSRDHSTSSYGVPLCCLFLSQLLPSESTRWNVAIRPINTSKCSSLFFQQSSCFQLSVNARFVR